MGSVSKELDGLVHQIAQQKIADESSSGKYKGHPLLTQLQSLGTELWIDTGDLELAKSVWRKELTALTTNNTLANQVVQSGVMDDVIKETIAKLKDAASGLSREDLILEIGFVINCRIALRLVNEFHVKVSVELHPAMSRDLEKTLSFARRYFKVCPEFFIVKIPLTPEGYLAVRKLRRDNIPINFTLGFSARQNYLAARLSNPDFVNVFLGRLNQVVTENQIGNGEMVGEKVTLATQQAVAQARQQNPSVSTRLIGASIRNGDQIASLAGLDVLTIPPKAMEDFLSSKRKPNDVPSGLNAELEPGIDEDSMWGAKCSSLWDLPDSFISFVDQLVQAPGLDDMTGEELIGFCEARNISLFHRYSSQDLEAIQEQGKIPKFGAWSETLAIDDLMTQSALQSFTKDQSELDARIASFLK